MVRPHVPDRVGRGRGDREGAAGPGEALADAVEAHVRRGDEGGRNAAGEKRRRRCRRARMRPRQREHRMYALTLPSRSRGDEPQRRRGVVRDFRLHMTATLDLGRFLPGVGRGGHPSCADDDACSSEPLPTSASSRHDTSPFRAAAAHWGGTTPVDENAPMDTGTSTRSEREHRAELGRKSKRYVNSSGVSRRPGTAMVDQHDERLLPR